MIAFAKTARLLASVGAAEWRQICLASSRSDERRRTDRKPTFLWALRQRQLQQAVLLDLSRALPHHGSRQDDARAVDANPVS
ncbi:hypothetical protein C5689_03995 [Methylosinus sporium]|uniref:Transposase n=1 Tax=Methylosinus sporium TaxID=428 RepID=A0A2U1SUL9_METSR|nr:hypothetical protein C5689_03995 [Methylosinus sporium]